MCKSVLMMTVVGLLCGTAYGDNMVTIDKVILHFANRGEATAILSNDDGFLQSMGSLDRALRLQTDREVPKSEFVAFIAQQPLEWDAAEINEFTGMFESIRRKCAGLQALFPDTILLVKTTGLEEGHGCYCRGDNAVIFAVHELAGQATGLEFTLTHELFHILSRNNEAFKERLYKIVGFTKSFNLELDSALTARKATNPDASRNDYYFVSAVGDDTLALMPFLLFGSSYDRDRRGVFFDYIEFLFIGVEPGKDRCTPIYEDGKPLLLDPAQVPRYFELVGHNTAYIIHPEEVLADNFMIMIQGGKAMAAPEFMDQMSLGDSTTLPPQADSLPNPEIIEQMRGILFGESTASQ